MNVFSSVITFEPLLNYIIRLYSVCFRYCKRKHNRKCTYSVFLL